MSNDSSIVLIYTAYDDVMAGMVKSLLEENDIPVLKKYRGIGQYMSLFLGNTRSEIDLYISVDDFQKATELLAILESDEEE